MGDLNKPVKLPGPAGSMSIFRTQNRVYRSFVARAAFFGMPVTFLRTVGERYEIDQAWPIDHVYTNTYTNVMYLHSTTLQDLANLDVGKPLGQEEEILSAYHESTHAYLDLVEDRPKFKSFLENGVKYYQGAPMLNGGTSRIPEVLFQEACAEYVAHRAANWWSAFEALSNLLNGHDTKLAIQMVPKAIALYNEKMAQRIFGYEDLAWYDSTENRTLRPISDHIKRFLDLELLEGKIPDNFTDVSVFLELCLLL